MLSARACLCISRRLLLRSQVRAADDVEQQVISRIAKIMNVSDCQRKVIARGLNLITSDASRPHTS